MSAEQPHRHHRDVDNPPVIALTLQVAHLLDEYTLLSDVPNAIILPDSVSVQTNRFLDFLKRLFVRNKTMNTAHLDSLTAFPDAAAQAEGLLIDWGIGPQLSELVGRMPRLRWVHVVKTGVDHLPLTVLRQRGITVTCIKGVYSGAVAEFVIGLVYCRAKHLLEHKQLSEKQGWQTLWSMQLKGKHMIVLGTGEIGQAIAQMAAANGIRSFGVNSNGHPVSGFTQVVATTNLMDILPKAEVIVNCLPLTAETQHLLDREAFQRMRSGSIFINVGRDESVVSQALLEGLRHGRPAWAALDIDPPAKGHPYWRHPDILLTHHCAYTSESARLALANATMRNVESFTTSRDFNSIVDLDKGY